MLARVLKLPKMGFWMHASWPRLCICRLGQCHSVAVYWLVLFSQPLKKNTTFIKSCLRTNYWCYHAAVCYCLLAMGRNMEGGNHPMMTRPFKLKKLKYFSQIVCINVYNIYIYIYIVYNIYIYILCIIYIYIYNIRVSTNISVS